MFRDIGLQFVSGFADLLQHVFELELGFGFGLAQRHLYAAMSVDLALARSFDRQVDHVLVMRHHRRLRAVGLR